MSSELRSGRQVLSLVGALFILVGVVLVYGRAWSRDRWPSGHPWSGVTILLLGIMTMFQGFPALPWENKILRWSGAAAVLTSVMIWFMTSYDLS